MRDEQVLDDHVVALARGAQMVAAVFGDEARARIAVDAPVVVREVGGREIVELGDDLDEHDLLDRQLDRRRREPPGGRPDHEHALRIGVEQQRQPSHALVQRGLVGVAELIVLVDRHEALAVALDHRDEAVGALGGGEQPLAVAESLDGEAPRGERRRGEADASAAAPAAHAARERGAAASHGADAA